MLDINSIFIGQNSQRNSQAVHKCPRLLDACGKGGIEDDDAIFSGTGVEGFGLSGAFVAIYWVVEGGHGPHPPLLIPVDGDEFSEALRFLGDQFDLKAWRDSESGAFFVSGEWRCFRGLFGRRCGGKRVGSLCWREFFDGQVFDFNQGFAASVDLDAEFSGLDNFRIRFGVVYALDAVDPGPNPSALGVNDILVPVVFFDHWSQGDHIRCRHEFVSARLIINGSIPSGFTVVALISRHFGIVWHPLTANLKA